MIQGGVDDAPAQSSSFWVLSSSSPFYGYWSHWLLLASPMCPFCCCFLVFLSSTMILTMSCSLLSCSMNVFFGCWFIFLPLGTCELDKCTCSLVCTTTELLLYGPATSLSTMAGIAPLTFLQSQCIGCFSISLSSSSSIEMRPKQTIQWVQWWIQCEGLNSKFYFKVLSEPSQLGWSRHSQHGMMDLPAKSAIFLDGAGSVACGLHMILNLSFVISMKTTSLTIVTLNWKTLENDVWLWPDGKSTSPWP